MYVEGLVLPVKTARKDDYRALCHSFGALYREFGATRVVETWAEDVPKGELTSFPRAVALAEDETVVLSWMEFPDKATRDAAHKAVWEDPRVKALQMDGIIAGDRMFLGGFETLMDLS